MTLKILGNLFVIDCIIIKGVFVNLQEQITIDMRSAMKAKNTELVNNLRVISGELQRQISQSLSDEEVFKILRKMYKSEQEMLRMSQKTASSFLEAIEKYLPKMAAKDEICGWIAKNIDFSKLKNKMMAMKDILAHFGARTDGNVVKSILANL